MPLTNRVVQIILFLGVSVFFGSVAYRICIADKSKIQRSLLSIYVICLLYPLYGFFTTLYSIIIPLETAVKKFEAATESDCTHPVSGYAVKVLLIFAIFFLAVSLVEIYSRKERARPKVSS